MSLTSYLTEGLLPEEEKKQTTAVYAGGFKPPTAGHFEVVEKALKQNPEIDEFIIFIGTKERNGISQDESLLIWEVYNNYLPFKVKLEPTSIPPIKAVYDFAKNHPTREVLWIIGAREGNDEDFKDISARTTSISKYPNLELRTIITQGGVSGTAARNASKISLEKFIPFLPTMLNPEEQEEVYNIVADKIQENDPEDGKAAPYGSGYKKLKENASYKQYIDVQDKIDQLTQHMIDKGMNVLPLPSVEFVDGDSENASDFFGKTAYYDPSEQHIVLYTEGRHPKDIVRSYAHEMIHHIQHLEDRLGDIPGTDTTSSDHLTKLEKEANLRGTMTFRNWTDSILNEDIKKINYINPNFKDEWEEAIRYPEFKEMGIKSWIEIANKGYVTNYSKIKDKLGNVDLKFDSLEEPKKQRFQNALNKGNIEMPIAVKFSDNDYDLVAGNTRISGLVKNKIDPKIWVVDLSNNLNEAVVGDKIECDGCGWSWNIVDGGNDLFMCHKCGHNNEPISEGKKKDPFGLLAYAQELGRLREDESEYKVYLDMDGVLADFDQRFRDLSGMEPSEFESKYGRKAFWNLIDEEHKIKFWVGIKPMDGASSLVDAVKDYDYELLTSPSAKKQSYLGKILWVKNHTGDVFPSKPRINFKKAKEKHLIKPQLAKTDILIDDREDTIGRWNAAGGTGIVYKSIGQTLNDLKKLGL